MPVPTSYTYETFRDYLETEVLQNVAKTMDWVDKDTSVEYVEVPIQGTIEEGVGTIYLKHELAQAISVGTPIRIKLIDGITNEPYKVYAKYTVEAAKVIIPVDGVPEANTSWWATGTERIGVDTTIVVAVGDEEKFDADPIYASITNEALFRLGRSTPEEVLANEIDAFRLLGRIEAWRAVVFNTVTDTDLINANTTMMRSQVHAFALQQLAIAEAEYDNLYPLQVPTIGKPRAMTYAGQVTARW